MSLATALSSRCHCPMSCGCRPGNRTWKEQARSASAISSGGPADAPARIVVGEVRQQGFATKPALGRQMIACTVDACTAAAWVAGDEVYGNDAGFQDELVARGIGYVFRRTGGVHRLCPQAAMAWRGCRVLWIRRGRFGVRGFRRRTAGRRCPLR